MQFAPFMRLNAQAALFNPTTITGMVFAFDVLKPETLFNAGTNGVNAPGTRVQQWQDYSGVGHHATNATPESANTGPVYGTNGPNGKPSLGGWAVGAPNAFFVGVSNCVPPFTFVTVQRHQTSGLNQPVLCANGGNNWLLLSAASAPDVFQMWRTSFACDTESTTNWYVTTWVFDGASSLIRTNGVIGGTGNPGTATANGPFRFGAMIGPFVHDGHICRVWMWNRHLTTNEMVQAENACIAEFGL